MELSIAGGKDFSGLTMEQKKGFRVAETLMRVNIMAFEGAMTWRHEEVDYNQHGTLRQALSSDLWKEHGHPYAELWILHADRQGYDYIGPVTYLPDG